jgi:hypothetical protein
VAEPTVAENPPEPGGETAATPAKPKYKRPPTIGDRRRVRGDAPELEMIERLGAQAQEILQLAMRVEGDEQFQNFQDYLDFRDKISEFESFCNVIESHLKELVSDRRQELEDRFYSLWAMIFRPTLRALLGFFDRIEDEEVLPLGGKDMLETELRAVQAMRNVLAAPRFAAKADKEMLPEINRLEAILTKLSERATSLPDFSNRPGVSRQGHSISGRAAADSDPAEDRSPAVEAPRPAPPPAPAMPTASTTATLGEAPNLKAVRELKGLLEYYKRDKTLRQYVDIDTRAVDEIERKLVANPMDPAAIVWMRQICNAWGSRLRMDEKDKDIRRVLATIKSN